MRADDVFSFTYSALTFKIDFRCFFWSSNDIALSDVCADKMLKVLWVIIADNLRSSELESILINITSITQLETTYASEQSQPGSAHISKLGAVRAHQAYNLQRDNWKPQIDGISLKLH